MSRVVFTVAATSQVLQTYSTMLDLSQLLSPPETARMRRLRRATDRDDFLAARVLARVVLCRHLDLAVTTQALCGIDISQRCATCGAVDHGRPDTSAPGVAVSWSHSGGVVAAAAGCAPIGIDVQHPPSERDAPPEGSWRDWVRSEALIKIGVGDLDHRAITPPAGCVVTEWQDELGYGAVVASTEAARFPMR